MNGLKANGKRLVRDGIIIGIANPYSHQEIRCEPDHPAVMIIVRCPSLQCVIIQRNIQVAPISKLIHSKIPVG